MTKNDWTKLFDLFIIIISVYLLQLHIPRETSIAIGFLVLILTPSFNKYD
jgi:hypothetical protein